MKGRKTSHSGEVRLLLGDGTIGYVPKDLPPTPALRRTKRELNPPPAPLVGFTWDCVDGLFENYPAFKELFRDAGKRILLSEFARCERTLSKEDIERAYQRGASLKKKQRCVCFDEERDIFPSVW